MVTRLYFHTADSPILGLPTVPQSVLHAEKIADDLTVNRSMNTTIGSAKFDIVAFGPQDPVVTSTRYFTRFVSPLLNQTSIAAGAWTYAFAATEGGTGTNYPVSGSGKSVWVNCYVWQPSTGSVVGTILDGNTEPTVNEGTGLLTFHITNFNGSAVSGITPADAVIIFEPWFICTTGTTGIANSAQLFFNGTTTYANDTVSLDPASYIETNQTLYFIQNAFIQKAVPAQTVIVSDSITRRATKTIRLIETVGITDSITRLRSGEHKAVQLSIGENVAISDSVVRALTRTTHLNLQRSLVEDIRVLDSLSRDAQSGTIIYTGDPTYFKS